MSRALDRSSSHDDDTDNGESEPVIQPAGSANPEPAATGSARSTARDAFSPGLVALQPVAVQKMTSPSGPPPESTAHFSGARCPLARPAYKHDHPSSPATHYGSIVRTTVSSMMCTTLRPLSRACAISKIDAR